eukprot:49560-Chlamydomonas_euryale.AAC.1
MRLGWGSVRRAGTPGVDGFACEAECIEKGRGGAACGHTHESDRPTPPGRTARRTHCTHPMHLPTQPTPPGRTARSTHCTHPMHLPTQPTPPGRPARRTHCTQKRQCLNRRCFKAIGLGGAAASGACVRGKADT